MLLQSQIYNVDKTVLFLCSVPENTQISKYENLTSGRKINKDRISVLLCANANGLYKLTPVIVGKSCKSRFKK